MEGVKPFQDKREDSDESGLKKESLQGTSREKRTTKKIRRGSGSPKIDTEKSPSAEGETAKPQAPGEETDDKHGLTVEVEAALQPMEDAGPLPDNREDSDESVGKKERFQGTSRHERKPKKTTPESGLLESDHPESDQDKRPRTGGETPKRKRSPSPAPRKKKFPWRQFRGVRLRLERCQKNAS
jgi:hypothetical protein